MGANKFSNLQKCGEILIDIKSKNRKNKIYIFHCTFCNTECDQLKKFSLHIGEEHLSNFEDILEETVIKFEAEPEEIKMQTYADVEGSPTIKLYESPVHKKINTNPDPLDTVNAVSTVVNHNILNCEVKRELKENSNDESTICEKDIMEYTASLGDSDNEDKLRKPSVDTSLVFDSDSADEINDDLDQMPLKKRKLNVTKKGTKLKQKPVAIEMCSDESKDADNNDHYVGTLEMEHDLLPISSRNNRKDLRNAGKAYTTVTGKIVSERKVRELEDCKNKCREKVSKEHQEMIFKNYWNLGYYHHRQMFVASLIDVLGTRTQRKNRSLTNPRTRNYTFKYYLEVYGQRISVCQKCFRYTLCETEQFIRTTMKKKIEGTVTDGDSRGKHGKHLKSKVKSKRQNLRRLLKKIDTNYYLINQDTDMLAESSRF